MPGKRYSGSGRREEQVALPAHVLGHIRHGHLAGNGFINAQRILVVQLEELIQAVMHHLGMLDQVDHGLLLPAQVLISQERLAAAAAHRVFFYAFQLTGDAAVIPPVRVRPGVVAPDLFDGLVSGQRAGDRLGVNAGPEIDVPILDAEYIPVRRDGRPNIARANTDRVVDVEQLHHLAEVGAPGMLHHLYVDLGRPPIVSRDAVRLLAL